MSKVLKDAALVVGVVAIGVATAGVGAFGAAAAAAAASAASAGGLASAAALGTARSIGAAGLTVLAGLTAKKPSATVSPMTWKSDPEAGIPYVMGRFYQGGQIVYRQAWKDNNSNQTIVTVLSAGPINAFEGLYVDGVQTPISGNIANITDRGKLYVSYQLGAQPEARQLGDLGPPDWSATSKLSGLAATSITLVYDPKGKTTFTTEPQVGWVLRGVNAYDPRKDDTYPGGAGPQRATDETTWTYTQNPYLHALTWLIGRRHNGKLVVGVGVPLAAILTAQFVEGANVADAQGWTISGAVSTTDAKWESLKKILAAGAGEPLRLGAQIGCLVQTPRVSLATISADDVIGDASVQATQARRDRINAIVPRYMAEQSETLSVNGKLQTTTTWGLLSASPVVVQDYVTFDGGQRQKQVDYEFVTALKQAQQLARYDIENAREFGPITLPLKLRWYGYKPGDVVTIQHPEIGLPNQDVLILSRTLHPEDVTVSITARSETFAKHAFALGQTGTAPPTPTVSGPPLLPIPGATAWAITAEAITANGTTIPALVIAGAVDSTGVDAVLFEYRVSTSGQGGDDGWLAGGVVPSATTSFAITGVQDKTAYQVAVSYRVGPNTGARLILGPVTAGQTSMPWDTGVSDPNGTKPDNNATNSADPTSPFGPDMTVAQAIGIINDAAVSLGDTQGTAGDLLAQANATVLAALQSQILIDADRLRLDALTLIDGEKVHLVLRQEVQDRTEGQTQIHNVISLIGELSSDGSDFIINLDQVKVSPTESFAGHLTKVQATLQSGIDAAVTHADTAVANEAGARATAITQVQASITSGQSAAITQVDQARINRTQALATRVTQINTDLSNNKANITYVDTAVSTERDARAQSEAKLVAQFGNGSGNASSAQVQSLSDAIANEVSARATQYGNISAELGGHDASIDFLQQALVTASGGAVSKVILQANADGHLVGQYFTATGTSGAIVFMADSVTFLLPDGSPLFVLDQTIGAYAPKLTVGRLTYDSLVPHFGQDKNSLSASRGFQVLPGGFIIQWGRVRQTIGQEQQFTVQFPMQFPNGTMAVNATAYLNSFSGDHRDLWMQNVGNPSTSQATFGTQATLPNQSTIDGFDWMAFGY